MIINLVGEPASILQDQFSLSPFVGAVTYKD
jgi:hypothetical protein